MAQEAVLWHRTLPRSTEEEIRAVASMIGRRTPRRDWPMLIGMFGIDGVPVRLTKGGPL